MRHSSYGREKYTVICANLQVINTIMKGNRDNCETNIKMHKLFINIFIPSFAIQYPSYTTLVRLGQSLMRLHKLMSVFFTFNIQISNSN